MCGPSALWLGERIFRLSTEVPSDLRYTTDHEWARLGSDGEITVGITDYAQDSLGDVVYVELSASGEEVKAGGSFGEVQSPKAVSDLYAPVSGTISAVNSTLDESPEIVNDDPYGEGWLVSITPSNPAEFESLMTADEYTSHLETLEE